LIEHVGRHSHVDANALHFGSRRRDEHGNAVLVLSILHDVFEGARFWRGFAIGRQAFKMQRQSFGAHVAGFIEILAGADHAGKVWKRDAVVAAGVFVDQGDVLSHFLSRLFQLQTRLLFDASERSGRDISTRVGYRYPPRFGRMFELNMTSLLGDLTQPSAFNAEMMALEFMSIYTHSCGLFQVYKYTLERSLDAGHWTRVFAEP